MMDNRKIAQELAPEFVPADPAVLQCSSAVDLRDAGWEFCEFRFRGLAPEIGKLKRYLRDHGAADYRELEVSGRVMEIRVAAGHRTPELITGFPALKATGLAENWYRREVDILFSESGYGCVTRTFPGGCFDPAQESGPARWEWEYDMMERVRTEFTWMQTGEQQRVSYWYPFDQLWNDSRYTREVDGTIYVRRACAEDFEIEDGKLVAYHGSGGDVVIPDTVQEISRYPYVFAGIPAITAVFIPGSVRSVVDHGFQGCKNLRKVVLGEGVAAVEVGAFRDCTALTELVLPQTLVSLACNAFWGCTELDVAAVRFPPGIRHAGQAFRFCKNDPELLLSPDGTVFLSSRVHREPFALALPETVTQIGRYALHQEEHLTGIALPRGLLGIGSNAFERCAALESIRLPDSVEAIGTSAFSGCRKLTRIRFPAGMKTIPGSLFSNSLVPYSGPNRYNPLREVTVSEGTGAIEAYAFYGCANLESVRLPESLETIGPLSFTYCEKLPALELPEGLKALGAQALLGCKSLRALRLPEGVRALEEEVLRECVELRQLDLPRGMQSIGKKALWGCASLERLVLGDEVWQIGEGAFAKCEALRWVELPASLRVLGKEAFKGCSHLESLTIPGTVQEIPLGLAQNCKALRRGRIGPGVQKIGGRAFRDCARLEMIEIPSSVKKLGARIFDGCPMLTICCEKGSAAEKYALDNQIRVCVMTIT